MLILAGVSLNAIIGDNGIITQAQNATYMQSVAALEEYLQQEYVKKYDQLSPYDNKLDGFIYDSELRKIIQKASNNSYYFLDSENYKEYYFIEKSALPDDIKNQIKGGDTSLTGTGIYAIFDDIYGVTSDLRVFYCSSGTDTRIGATDTAQETNLEKVVISADDPWSSALGYNRDITLSDLRSQKDITVTTDGLDLNQLIYFGSLEKITFDNCTYPTLEGIQNAPNLYYVCFYNNCSVDDYNALRKSKKFKIFIFMEFFRFRNSKIM